MEYFESLIPLFNSADFLKHKLYIERYIEDYRKRIESEKRREFMRD